MEARAEKITMDELSRELSQYNCTDNYYRCNFSPVKYTDGVKMLAELAGAYWLIDAIVSYKRQEPFQVWTLDVMLAEDNRYHKCVLTMKEDSDCPVLVTQKIEYTDFPIGTITLWLIDGVLILPSEY